MSTKKKNILVIDFHPDAESFCAALAQQYCRGARDAGYGVTFVALRELTFDPILHYGYRSVQPLEPDLRSVQNMIREAEHLVFVGPVWWGTLPALAKGFFDRTFISGFSHVFDLKRKRPRGLLFGRSASVIYTQGAPWFYSLFFVGDAFWKVCKRAILSFSGLSPIKRKYFDTVKSGTDDDRKRILQTGYVLGKKGF